MFFRVVEAVACCLDRESARKLNRLKYDDDVLSRAQELEYKDQHGLLTPDERLRAETDLIALQFVSHLQVKARAVLRRPAASQHSPKKKSR